MKLEKYYENPEVLHVGTEPDRTYYIPYFKAGGFDITERESSDRFISLNEYGASVILRVSMM